MKAFWDQSPREASLWWTSVCAALTLSGDVVSAKRRLMTLHCVEACGHQNHIRTELLGDGHHHTPTRTHTRDIAKCVDVLRRVHAKHTLLHTCMDLTAG